MLYMYSRYVSGNKTYYLIKIMFFMSIVLTVVEKVLDFYPLGCFISVVMILNKFTTWLSFFIEVFLS